MAPSAKRRFAVALAVIAVSGGLVSVSIGGLFVLQVGHDRDETCSVSEPEGTVPDGLESDSLSLFPIGISCVWRMSDGSEKNLLLNASWSTTMCLLGGSVLAVAGVVVLIRSSRILPTPSITR